MREVKFRGWDKELDFMISIEKYKINLNGEIFFDNDDKNLYNQSDKIVIMQYTGLKDKNGVEIYEGDYMLDGHSGRWAEVKFIKGAFVIEFDNEIQDLYDWTCECVIGNKYENKESLA